MLFRSGGGQGKSWDWSEASGLIEQGYDGSYNGDAYGSVMYQNENLSVRVSDEFMQAANDGGDWWTRADAAGIVHALVGKLSLADGQIADNITAFINHIRSVKPAAVKGNYIRSITVSASMSPGVPVIAASAGSIPFSSMQWKTFSSTTMASSIPGTAARCSGSPCCPRTRRAR